MIYCAVFGVCILLNFTYGFITPSGSEPECPAVQCETVDPQTCRCICDQESSCAESPSRWPLGYYGLPASIYGCPDVTWETKYINITIPSDAKDIFWETSGLTYFYNEYNYFEFLYNGSLQILGPYSERTVQLNFCVREDGDFNDLSNLNGNFCIYKISTQCLDGYVEGSITITGYLTEVRGFRTNITTTDGGVVISFCCRSDGISTLSDMLPHTYPFVFLKGPTSGSCDTVTNMTVTEDVLYLTKDGVEFDFNGTLPSMTITDSHVGISFCVYQPESYRDAVTVTDSDIKELKTLPVYSIGRPCYSSPYVESPTNNLKYVVDGEESVFISHSFTTVEVYRPWLQIDLQQFVQIRHVVKTDRLEPSFPDVDLYGVYVSTDQWDFVHHGAIACFFGLTYNTYVCKRPVIGQYVTLVLEKPLYRQSKLAWIDELGVYGQANGCGRQLGMISGDIKEFQIETSSNFKDIQYSRALQGTRGWCTSEKDTERWLMIDLIAPTTVQGIALHGWFQVKRMYIDSFMVEYGVKKNNLTLYSDFGTDPKLFTVDTSQDVFNLQKFWFLSQIVARYIKIRIVKPNKDIACLKIEVIGCPVYGSRNIMCNKNSDVDPFVSSQEKMMDYGFASTRYIHVDFKYDFLPPITCSGSKNMTFEVCQKFTLDSGYIGNIYNEDKNECCLYNISSTNRHFRNSWRKEDNPGYIVSERLCFNELTNINNIFRTITEIRLEFPGTIQLLHSPLFPSNYPKGIEQDIFLFSAAYIKLTIIYLSFAETATTNQLIQAGHPEIHPSYCQDSLTIDMGTDNMVKLTRDNQSRYRHSSFMSTGNRVAIKFTSCFQYLTSSEVLVFEFHAEYIDRPGCGVDGSRHATCTEKTAFLASFLYPALYTLSDTNVWEIRGRYGQYIELKFLELDVYSDKTISFVEVFDIDLDGKRLPSIGRFSKASMPRVNLVSSWHMMDVEFRAGSDRTGKGFLGLYTIIDAPVEDIVKGSCNDTWYNFKTSCYKLFPHSKTTQKTAEIRCLSNGGHLVTIHSEEELVFINRLLINTTVLPDVIDRIYLGLAKRNKGYTFSDYQWVNGEPMIYSAWYRNEAKGTSQPDGFDNEQCVALILDSIHNKHNWHDVPCAYDNIHYIMCEIRVDTPDLRVNKTDVKLFSSAAPSSVGFNMHRCGNAVFISGFFVCDGYIDCSDDSDEMMCEVRICNYSQLKCANGKCIHLTFYCDGIFHCDDGSDESYCEWPDCAADEWQCNNKQCINIESRCDAKQDCYDGSDEKECVYCSPTSHQCYDRSCVSPHRICDGISDCPGRFNEDEMNCQTRQIQASCEEWWLIGARTNGMYFINHGLTDHELVNCQFTEKSDKVMITTSFFYAAIQEPRFSTGGSIHIYKEYLFPVEIIKTLSHMSKYICSQKVLITCYFHEGLGDHITDRYHEAVVEACNGSCNCIGTTNWTEADPNKVLIDNISISDETKLPFYFFEPPTLPYSDEGFYDVQVGPVHCTSEISKNNSADIFFLCGNGKLYDYKDKCLMHVNEFNDVSGCRDMSHLKQCENVTCPDSYFKCPEGHCLSPNLVCDDNKHCINGEDELNCGNLVCPGLFMCKRLHKCLSHDQVCDGTMQCPSGDDEIGCGIICPSTCTCDGFVFTCHYTSEVEKLNVSAKARKLDLSNSIFPDGRATVNHFPFLAELIMFNCSIVSIEPYTFKGLKNLILLDLSFNRVEKLHRCTFYGLHRLDKLILKGNSFLTIIEPNTFLTLRNVQNLELVGFNINKLQSGTFRGLENLKELNISGNGIRTVDENAFTGLSNLLSIDLRFNNIEDFFLDVFTTFKNLTEMRTDSYVFCCLKPVSVLTENCFPQPDDFSSCTDLMKNDVLRVCLWIIGISALVGNAGVLLYRIVYERNSFRKSNGFYIMNLGLSDLIMGVYLCVIAITDISLRGNYIIHDKEWRQSVTCKVAGVLAFISCEASATFILLITIDCFLMVKFPFGNRRITPMYAKISSIVTWFIVTLLSIIPFLHEEYFSEDYYSQTAVCLVLPFSRYKVSGWEYSAAVFIFYNCVAFLIIAYCQLSIYNTGKSGSRIKAKKTRKDLDLARRLFLMVFTNFICWFPVGIMGIMALTGEAFPSETYSWVAVFVIPVNAAINPFLYTFSIILKKQKPKILSSVNVTLLRVSTYKRSKKDSVDSLIVASTFVESEKDLYMNHLTLKELFRSRKLVPKESYLLLTQLTKAVVYLHRRFLTMCQPISPESVVVIMDHQVIKRMKIISRVKEITGEIDTTEDVEGIGIVAKQILKYTVYPKQMKYLYRIRSEI